MSGPNDPLRLLRNTLANRQTIHLLPSSSPTSVPVYTLSECTHLSFPSPNSSNPSNERIVLAKSTPTRFKRTTQATSEQTWDIQSLLLCYLRRDASIAEYAQEAVKEGCELVGIMQRRIVADYLEGKDTSGQAVPYILTEADIAIKTSGTDQEDGNQAAQSGLVGDHSLSSTRDDSLSTSIDANRPAKKTRYIVNKEDLEAYKRIIAYWEPKQISDRTTVLRGSVKKGNFASVRDMVQERLKAGKEDMKKGTHGHGQSHHHGSQVSGNAASQPAMPAKRRREFVGISASKPLLISHFYYYYQ